LNDALSVYANNLHACHDLWGNTELEKYALGYIEWFRLIQDYRQKNKERKAMDPEMMNNEGKIDASPMDMELATRL